MRISRLSSLPLRWRVAAFLFVAGALNYGDRSAFAAIMHPLQKDMGLSDIQIGTVSALFLWVYGMGSPFAGILADRGSRTRVVVWSLVLWSLFAGLTGFTHGLVMLCLVQVAMGLSECMFNPAGFALLADHYVPSMQGRVMGLVSVGCQIGVVAGGASAGWIAEHYGWRTSFRILGILGLALAAVSQWFLADAPRQANAPTTRVRFGEALRYLVRVPSYHIILVKQILAELPTWVFFAWFPTYLLETFHMSTGTAGFAATFILQASVGVGTLMGGWVSDLAAKRREGYRMVALALCYVCAVPFPLVFLAHPGLAVVAVAVAGYSLFRGLAQTNERPIMCEIVPVAYRATAFGIWGTCAAASGSVGIFVTGALKQRFGLNLVFGLSSVLFALTAIVLFIGYRSFLRRDSRRAQEFELRAVAGLSAPTPDAAHGTA